MAKYYLDDKTISGLLRCEESNSIYTLALNEQSNDNRFERANAYLQALINCDEEESRQDRDLGLCRLKILIEEGLPKKVCILRNGMLITDELNGIKRFGNYKDFVAVFECLSTEGNSFLRDMEPPQHNDFEFNRLTDDKKEKGRIALERISRWIREMIKRHATNPVEDVTEIDELSEFFGAESDKSGGNDEEINPSGSLKITAKPIKRKSKKAKFANDSEYGADGESGSDRRKKGQQGNGGKNSGEDKKGQGDKGRGKNPVELENVRISRNISKEIKIYFTPQKSTRILVKLLIAGADSDYIVPIDNIKHGKNTPEGIIVEVREGVRTELIVKPKTLVNGAFKVIADEI